MSALGIRTVIAATDLTDAMHPALISAARLVELTGAQLHVVHTTEHTIPESRLHDHLQAAGIHEQAAGNARILVGPPGAIIVQEAARLEADVIVLGPHRPGRSNLGSTAYRVVRDAQTPCLMLPISLSLPLSRVLTPTDLSEPSRGALAIALTWTLALRRRAQDDKAAATELHTLFVTGPDAHDRSDKSAKALNAEVDAVCRAFGVSTDMRIIQHVETGTPASVILDTADRESVDLIVIGTRGLSLQKEPLGSVSYEVVTRAKQPVLLVPPGVWRADA